MYTGLQGITPPEDTALLSHSCENLKSNEKGTP
jgi:hypothetical protein